MTRLPPPLEPLADGRNGESGTRAAHERLVDAGVQPYAWSNAPADRYAAHDHPFTKLLICAEGSITFLIGTDELPAELQAGDGIVMPAGTRHGAVVGPEGCTCLEGRR